MIAATRPWAGPPVSLTDTEHPPNWRARAACLAVDPELFFPPGEPGSTGYDRAAQDARAVCHAGCPVIAECLEDALAVADKWAIRGGLDPDEREKQFGRLCDECGKPFRTTNRRATCSKECADARSSRLQQRANTRRRGRRQRKAVAT